MDLQDLEYEYEERAAILEYDAGMPREQAEQTAREMCERNTEVSR